MVLFSGNELDPHRFSEFVGVTLILCFCTGMPSHLLVIADRSDELHRVLDVKCWVYKFSFVPFCP